MESKQRPIHSGEVNQSQGATKEHVVIAVIVITMWATVLVIGTMFSLGSELGRIERMAPCSQQTK